MGMLSAGDRGLPCRSRAPCFSSSSANTSLPYLAFPFTPFLLGKRIVLSFFKIGAQRGLVILSHLWHKLYN